MLCGCRRSFARLFNVQYKGHRGLAKGFGSYKCTETVQKSMRMGIRLTCRSPSLVRRCLTTTSTVPEENAQKNEIPQSPEEGDSINYELLFKEIANGDPELEKKLKIAEFELNLLRERYSKMPKNLRSDQWIYLTTLNSTHSKMKYLSYLFKTEAKKLSIKKNKEMKRLTLQNKREEIQSELHAEYGLMKNSMFLRIFDVTLIKLLNERLLTSLLYSQHIVFDCSYDFYMSSANKKYCARQIQFGFSVNRSHRVPFHIKLCNADTSSETVQNIRKFLSFSEDNTPVDMTEKSYLDIYPKDRIVYLTPHCKQVLYDFNENDIYVIGAYVDKGHGKKVSLAKAKEANLRMAKFPIDTYLNWEKGSKTLPLNIVLKIMLDLKFYGSWNVAFKNIPDRCTEKEPISSDTSSV